MANYISSVGRFYKEETLCFEFRLMLGSEAVWCRDYDIEMYVYTSDLSRRLRVCDYSAGIVKESFRLVSDCGASILRKRDSFLVKLTPQFLRKLPDGVLTFGLRYIGDSFESAEVLKTDPFSSIAR